MESGGFDETNGLSQDIYLLNNIKYYSTLIYMSNNVLE